MGRTITWFHQNTDFSFEDKGPISLSDAILVLHEFPWDAQLSNDPDPVGRTPYLVGFQDESEAFIQADRMGETGFMVHLEMPTTHHQQFAEVDDLSGVEQAVELFFNNDIEELKVFMECHKLDWSCRLTAREPEQVRPRADYTPERLELVEEWARRKHRYQRVAGVMLLVLFAAICASITLPLQSKYSDLGFVTVMIVLGGMFVFHRLNWRCPACETYLGRGLRPDLNPKSCPNCRIPLE